MGHFDQEDLFAMQNVELIRQIAGLLIGHLESVHFSLRQALNTVAESSA